MVVSVILGHPQTGSFNHAIAQTAVTALEAVGHEVRFHDLCAEGFEALLPAGEADRSAALPPAIAAHSEEIASADGIVIVHPNWWGQPPAILKGWVDRVLRVDVAYKFEEGDSGEGIPLGLLRARAAVVFNTSNTPAERERDVFGDPLEALWRDCIFSLCGVEVFERRMFGVVVTSTLEERQAWLAEVRRIVTRHFPPCRR
jgi:NAD(P)H dehydrogenase (quinone)